MMPSSSLAGSCAALITSYQPKSDPKKSLTRRLIRYTKIATATGTPTIALGSVPRSTFVTSPIRLIAIKLTAIQYPLREARQSPIAATAQHTDTVDNRTTAQTPSLERFSCARGFRRQNGSRKMFGRNKDIAAVRLIVAPTRKKALSAVIPPGRVLGSLVT